MTGSVPNVQNAETVISRALQLQPPAYLVGIAGIPGSGKTTLCQALVAHYPGAAVVPMDGYHLPRSQLDAEGLRRRGAPHTFNASAFRADIARLRQSRGGLFPAFDHAEKDPRPDAIRVTPQTPLVIVEGNYVLMRDWQLEDLFDLRVFIDWDLETAIERLIKRHVASGICATPEEARDRALNSDRLNALQILADGCRERADLVVGASA
jgi:pantothenate kinase